MGEILACRVCMSTNVKLYDMFDNKLITAYQILTGLKVSLQDKLPKYVCGVCSTLLLKCTQFRETSRRTHTLLKYLYQQKQDVTTEYIESLKLNYHPLSYLSLYTVVIHDPGESLLSDSTNGTMMQLVPPDEAKESIETHFDTAQSEVHAFNSEDFHDEVFDSKDLYDIVIIDSKNLHDEMTDSKDFQDKVTDIEDKVTDSKDFYDENIDSNNFQDEVTDIKDFHDIVKDSTDFHDEVTDTSDFHNEVIDGKDFHDEVTDSKDFHNEVTDSKGFRDRVTDSKNFYDEVTDSNDFHIEVTDSKDFHDIVDDSTDFHDEVTDTSDFHNEVIGGKDFHDEVTDSKDFHNEVTHSKDFHDRVTDSKDFHDGVTNSKDFHDEVTDSKDLKIKAEVIDVADFHDDVIEEVVIDNTDFKYDDVNNDSLDLDELLEDKTHVKLDQNNVEMQIEDAFTVMLLTQEQQYEALHARKLTTNYRTAPYKCDKCFRGYITEVTFKNHLMKHDLISGPYECDVCTLRFATKRAATHHYNQTHKKQYKCKEESCSFVTYARNHMAGHYKLHYGDYIVCRTCGATFRCSSHLHHHVRIQHPSKLVCTHCGESFIGRRSLLIHQAHEHPTMNGNIEKGAVFTCNSCRVDFRTKDALLKHIVTVVGDCTDCNACVYCGEDIGNSCDMEEHLRTHLEVRECNKCNESFTNELDYAIHQQQRHFYLTDVAKSKKSVGQPVMCEICGKKYKSRSILAYHQRVHTGELPFQCPYCPKKFSVHIYLRAHIRSHTGETPFPCNHCLKRFKDKTALNRHLRVHTGEKPYFCDHCGKSFSQSNSMKVHILTVHQKQPPPYKSKARKRLKAKDFSIVG